jgi:hypothetical protein
MTSPNEPPKESFRDRITSRLHTDSSGRLIDADARHTRNVSWMFYGLIVVILVVAIAGLAFGFWESNLKPLANVFGSEVSRGEWQDRQDLQAFRAERAESQVSAALAAGTIDSDLANRRFTAISNGLPSSAGDVMTELVDLLYMQQLAAGEGVELSEEELVAALAADGTFPESRLIEALIVITTEQEAGAVATDAGIADAEARAEAALAELQAGASAEDLVETYGPATQQTAHVNPGDISPAEWSEQLFSLEADGITSIVEAPTGEQLIGIVKEIVPEQPDPGFIEAVNDDVGEEIHRRNVELEAIAAKLEEQITADALETDYEQVKLAQIYVEGNPLVTEDGEGDVRASHILYQPETPLDDEGNPTEVADLPEDDPAWADAQLEAERAAGQLALVDDVDARVGAFASRAQKDSDGPTGLQGGDLGYFTREAMVPEFSDAIWEAEDPQRGDILGPVRSDFGWHVIQFEEFRAPLEERLAVVETALSQDGADFATVAVEYSDASDAADGGEMDWQLLDDLDDLTVLALTAIDSGEISEAVDDGSGYRIYLKQDQASRPLEPVAAAELAQTAFAEWYDDLYFGAGDDISIDESVYDDGSSAAPPVQLPAGGHGG